MLFVLVAVEVEVEELILTTLGLSYATMAVQAAVVVFIVCAVFFLLYLVFALLWSARQALWDLIIAAILLIQVTVETGVTRRSTILPVEPQEARAEKELSQTRQP
jgi:hypothetical protein